MIESPHREGVEALGLDPKAARSIAIYLDLVAAWGQRVNLTGARTPSARVQILVAAVLPALGFLEGGSLIDVGSGNGSPGLVLALLRPAEPATLLEPRGRRWAFLREAARAAGRPDIEVLRLRHDQYAGPSRRNLTVRALALPLAELAPLAEEGGRLLIFGGDPHASPPWSREADAALPQSRLHVFRRGCFT